jgi:hypothetical protein
MHGFHGNFSYDVTLMLKGRQPAMVGGLGLFSYGAAARSIHKLNIAGWSSPVARQAHNLKAAGSNPAPATKSKSRPSGRLFAFAGWEFQPFRIASCTIKQLAQNLTLRQPNGA